MSHTAHPGLQRDRLSAASMAGYFKTKMGILRIIISLCSDLLCFTIVFH